MPLPKGVLYSMEASQFIDDEAQEVFKRELDDMDSSSSSASDNESDSSSVLPMGTCVTPQYEDATKAWKTPHPGKSPWPAAFVQLEPAEEVDEVELHGEEVPDLTVYFAKFDLPHHNQIAICRGHANMLAALYRPKKYFKKRSGGTGAESGEPPAQERAHKQAKQKK